MSVRGRAEGSTSQTPGIPRQVTPLLSSQILPSLTFHADLIFHLSAPAGASSVPSKGHLLLKEGGKELTFLEYCYIEGIAPGFWHVVHSINHFNSTGTELLSLYR